MLTELNVTVSRPPVTPLRPCSGIAAMSTHRNHTEGQNSSDSGLGKRPSSDWRLQEVADGTSDGEQGNDRPVTVSRPGC